MVRYLVAASALCFMGVTPAMAVTAIDPVAVPERTSAPVLSANAAAVTPAGEIAAAILGLVIVTVAFATGRRPRSVAA